MLVDTSQAGDLGSQVDKTKEDPRRPGPGRPHASATATISFVLFGGEGVVGGGGTASGAHTGPPAVT
jgi:hypothetical protein